MMGVVLRAYCNPLVIPESELTFDIDGNPVHECFTRILDPVIHDGFPKHAADIESRGRYFWSDQIEHIASTTCRNFNNFRNWLAEICGYFSAYVYGRFNDTPIAGAWSLDAHGYVLDELFNFSDCEGTIGTKYCQKIYNDLEAIKCLVNQSDEYWVMFNRMLRGFKLAATTNGFVTLS